MFGNMSSPAGDDHDPARCKDTSISRNAPSKKSRSHKTFEEIMEERKRITEYGNDAPPSIVEEKVEEHNPYAKTNAGGKDASKPYMNFEEIMKQRRRKTDESSDIVSKVDHYESNFNTEREQKRNIGYLLTELKDILTNHNLNLPCTVEAGPIQLKLSEWGEIRLFISSSFIDTHGERDVIIKRIIPDLNHLFKEKCIRIIPIDLRWGVFGDRSRDCFAIQNTCLSEIDRCRLNARQFPFFLGIRTNRYGWVQEKMQNASEYDNPDAYQWVKLLEDNEKHLSITSLECVHAVFHATEKLPVPTILFCNRMICNPENIEKKFEWIFEFEYKDKNAVLNDDVKNQYTLTEHAATYKNDMEQLDDYLKSLNHVKYSEYRCQYQKGSARITGTNGGKNYGVGAVTDLNEFESMVRIYLTGLMLKNFTPVDMSEIPAHEKRNIPYEHAVKEKSSTFVGRKDMSDTIYKHCTDVDDDVRNSVMIVAAGPGLGKSALMAHISTKALNDLREKGNFIFVHGVDLCPDSNTLEKMLRRLHDNLGIHIKEENLLQSTAELKSSHVKVLEEIARNHPHMKFIILIDAVNQFYNSMNAYSMWYLPSVKAPPNLRVIVSTLTEKITYENSLKRCPEAKVVMVDYLTDEDAKEMVSTLLAKYNKQLTTDNSDSFLGNQMSKLLEKNKSPLYLSVAVEALRTQGVYENMSLFIERLPPTVPELFALLLENWEKDYGSEFIKYLVTIIALARNGFTEIMLNDIMSYIETNHETKFESTFAMIYGAIRGLLSSGGGGYLKFFHQQISDFVLEKYTETSFVINVHSALIDFFLAHLRPQLAGESVPTKSYYHDCLAQVVYHQSALRKFRNADGEHDIYKETLKNIFFVREQITSNEEKKLLSQYRDTVGIDMKDDERLPLSEWQRFTEFYWELIKDFPEWAVSFALSQPRGSAVAMETLSLPHPDVRASLPMEWLNKPTDVAEGGKTLKCVGESCWSCDTSDATNNLCAFGCGDSKALLCNQTTGDVIHQMKIFGSATSVHLSPSCENLWVGNNHGKVSVWNTLTGEQEHEDLEVGEGGVEMIIHIDETLVACGVGHKYEDDTVGTITLIDTTTHTITKSWSTELECMSYCYHTGQGVIISGHAGDVICWDAVSGREVNEFEVGEYAMEIQDMCAHPHLPLIVLVMRTQFASEVLTLDITTGEHEIIIPETGSGIAKFDHSGDNIITTDVNKKTIKFYNLDGVTLRTIRIHAAYVNNISPLPYPYSFISAGSDAGKIFTSTSENIVEGPSNVVTWCQLLTNKTEFVTLSDDGEVGVWDVSSLTLRGKVVVKHGMAACAAAVHPRGDIIIVCTWRHIYVVDLWEIKVINIMKAPDYDEGSSIFHAKVSPTGDKCMIVTADHGTHVYHIDNSNTLTYHLTFTHMKNNMYSCDIRDKYAVNGGTEGVVVWDTDTGVTTQELRTHHYCRYVQLLDHPPRVLYHMWEKKAGGVKDQIRIMDMCGNDLVEFNTKVNNLLPKVLTFNQYLITAEADGSLRLHNLNTGKTLFVFADRHALAFNGFVRDPLSTIISCYNDNGSRYDFKLK